MKRIGVSIGIRAAIYHGILNLLIKNNFTRAGTVSVVRIFHTLRELFKE